MDSKKSVFRDWDDSAEAEKVAFSAVHVIPNILLAKAQNYALNVARQKDRLFFAASYRTWY